VDNADSNNENYKWVGSCCTGGTGAVAAYVIAVCAGVPGLSGASTCTDTEVCRPSAATARHDIKYLPQTGRWAIPALVGQPVREV